jgi:hypothetical protein
VKINSAGGCRNVSGQGHFTAKILVWKNGGKSAQISILLNISGIKRINIVFIA